MTPMTDGGVAIGECSFCRAPFSGPGKFISEPKTGAAICDGCVRICFTILLDDAGLLGCRTARKFVLLTARKRLGDESGWACFYCRLKGNEDNGPDGRIWHVDHVYTVTRGGDEQPDNLVLACATCNLAKKDSTAAEFFASRGTA